MRTCLRKKIELSCIAVEFPLIICIILKLNLCALNSIPSWNLSINLDHFHAEISQKICEYEKCKSKCLTERCVVTCRSSCMHITCEKQKRWSIYFTTHALMNYSNPECVRFQLRPLFCSKFYEIKGFDLISIWEHWSLFYGFRLFFLHRLQIWRCMFMTDVVIDLDVMRMKVCSLLN